MGVGGVVEGLDGVVVGGLADVGGGGRDRSALGIKAIRSSRGSRGSRGSSNYLSWR